MTPPGEIGIAAPRRLGCDSLAYTLSETGEIAALLTSRRWFTEVSHEAQKPGIGMCLARGAAQQPRRSRIVEIPVLCHYSAHRQAALR